MNSKTPYVCHTAYDLHLLNAYHKILSLHQLGAFSEMKHLSGHSNATRLNQSCPPHFYLPLLGVENFHSHPWISSVTPWVCTKKQPKTLMQLSSKSILCLYTDLESRYCAFSQEQRERRDGEWWTSSLFHSSKLSDQLHRNTRTDPWGLLNFNYVFLLETIQNSSININIQPVYSNICFTEPKIPKDDCLKRFQECEHNR